MPVCMCFFKDRVVDDLNPGLNFTRKEVESLLHFVEEEAGQFHLAVQEDFEEVIYQACKLYPHLITKVRSHFTHTLSHDQENLLKDDNTHLCIIFVLFSCIL